jgi:hypothetical protein
MFKIMSCIALMFCLLMAASNGYAADTSIINEYDASGNLVTGDAAIPALLVRLNVFEANLFTGRIRSRENIR